MAARFAVVVGQIQREHGVPVIETRVSVTPVAAVIAAADPVGYTQVAEAMDRAACAIGVPFINGLSALVDLDLNAGARALIEAYPDALSQTERVVGSVNVGSTRSGVNVDALRLLGRVIRRIAERTSTRQGIGCVRLTVLCNAAGDSPHSTGPFHGLNECDAVIHVCVNGQGAVLRAVSQASDADLSQLAQAARRAAFHITRMGERVGRAAAARLNVAFGTVHTSLAATPASRDWVARIVNAMGLEHVGTHGSTAALALLNHAVKAGCAMASNDVGELSGTAGPTAEDDGTTGAASRDAMTFDKLAMLRSVCTAGLDIIAVPGDTPADTLSAILADEAVLSMVNRTPMAVRLVPAPGTVSGDVVEFGGLLGRATVMAAHRGSSGTFVARGGRIPAVFNGQ